MKVVFKTNLDAYQMNCFPDNLTFPPRIGETVLVNECFGEYFKNKKLPLRLEVVNVTWCDAGVVCELWYNKTDVVSARISGVNLF
jgi:hypothetical protein